MPRITEKEAGGRNMLAFLDMLAWSEIGERLLASSDDGYNVVVGGGQFKGYADHPRLLIDLPKLGIKSSAAGRYQLLQRYWDAYRVQLGLKGFSPENQDRIAIQQIRERRGVADIQAGKIEAAIEKVKNIWASLPGAGYGQHEQKMANLLAAYVKAGGVMKLG